MLRTLAAAPVVLLFFLWAVEARASSIDLLVNGGFDSGPGAPWVEVASFALIVDQLGGLPVPPHSGTFSAWLGGSTNNQDLLYQEFTIPAGATVVDVDLQRWIVTTELVGVAFDTVSITLRNTSGVVLETLGQWSNTDAGSGWSAASLPIIGSYSGQTVRLALESTNDASSPTSFFFDSVSFNVVPEPVPSLSALGMTLLGSLMGLAGWRWLRL